METGATVSCCTVGWHGRFIPCINENLAQSQFGDSTFGAAVATQQQNRSFQLEDRIVHQLQFTGGLIGKEQYCNTTSVCSCSAGVMWHCRTAISRDPKLCNGRKVKGC